MPAWELGDFRRELAVLSNLQSLCSAFASTTPPPHPTSEPTLISTHGIQGE